MDHPAGAPAFLHGGGMCPTGDPVAEGVKFGSVREGIGLCSKYSLVKNILYIMVSS